MRAAAFAGLSFLCLSGCGYVGPVVPPSPQIPSPIIDLKVVERGSDLVVTFTTPTRTLDNHAISQFSTIDLRLGLAIQPFDLEKWSTGAKEYDLPIPTANEKDVARAVSFSYKIDVAEWTGKHVIAGVRTAIKTDTNYSAWSNLDDIDVVPSLKTPAVSVAATAHGYHVTCSDEGKGVEYNIFRRPSTDQPRIQIATVQTPEYTDISTQWDTPYIYSVEAVMGKAASLIADSAPVNQHDNFPPAVPSGLAGLATADSIELSWHRNAEPDLKGYFVYRSTNGGAFEQLGPSTPLPAFTDQKITHGSVYRYQISAIDRTGNSSEKSPPVEVSFP